MFGGEGADGRGVGPADPPPASGIELDVGPGAFQYGPEGIRLGGSHDGDGLRVALDEVAHSGVPRPITIRWSTVSSISLMRWLHSRMVRPSAASPRNRSRIQRMPSVSSPFTGSSKINTPGSPSSAEPIPRRWPIPREKAADALVGDLGEADQVEDLVHPGRGDGIGPGQPKQVVVGRAPAMDRGGVEQRPDLAPRCRQSVVRPAVDGHLTVGGCVEPENEAHGRRLAGTVGPEEAGDATGPDLERHPIDGQRVAVALGHCVRFDHAPSLASRRPRRIRPGEAIATAPGAARDSPGYFGRRTADACEPGLVGQGAQPLRVGGVGTGRLRRGPPLPGRSGARPCSPTLATSSTAWTSRWSTPFLTTGRVATPTPGPPDDTVRVLAARSRLHTCGGGLGY